MMASALTAAGKIAALAAAIRLLRVKVMCRSFVTGCEEENSKFTYENLFPKSIKDEKHFSIRKTNFSITA
jgi:hypothetical protein